MDLRQYFKKIRDVEQSLTDQYPLVVSLETADGGKAGVISEVPRHVAAQLLVDGRAVIATEEQREAFISKSSSAKAAAEKAELSRRLQIAIIADPRVEKMADVKQTGSDSAGRK